MSYSNVCGALKDFSFLWFFTGLIDLFIRFSSFVYKSSNNYLKALEITSILKRNKYVYTKISCIELHQNVLVKKTHKNEYKLPKNIVLIQIMGFVTLSKLTKVWLYLKK
jgi:hypothetical protein